MINKNVLKVALGGLEGSIVLRVPRFTRGIRGLRGPIASRRPRGLTVQEGL